MKGRIFVRHLDNVKIIHSGRYLRLEGISVEMTDDWEDIAKDIHVRFDDVMWRSTLERIIKTGLTEYQKKLDIMIKEENPNE